MKYLKSLILYVFLISFNQNSFCQINLFYEDDTPISGILNLEISPKGNEIAYSFTSPWKGRDVLKICDYNKKKVKYNFEKNNIYDMKYSSSGNYFGYCYDDSISIIDMKNDKISSIGFQYPNCKIRNLCFSVDDGFLAFSTECGELNYLSIYDITNAKELCGFQFEILPKSIKFLNKSFKLAIIGGIGAKNGYLFVLDILSKNIEKYFKLDRSYNTKFDLTNNDSLFIHFGDKVYLYYDRISYALENPNSFANALSPDNNYVTVSKTENEKSVELININDRSSVYRIAIKSPFNNIKFSPDFKSLITLEHKNVKIYKIDNYFEGSNLYSEIFDSKRKEIDLAYSFHKKRDEFETIEEYIGRVSILTNLLSSIEDKYAKIISEKVTNVNNKKIIEQEQLSNTILQSIHDTTLCIQELIKFDPDLSEYSIKINGEINKISIPREEAISLKENFKKAIVKAKKKLKSNLKDWEIYEIIIVHPISYKDYIFIH